MTLRIVFCGTPAFALPSLEALLSSPEIEVLGVMTQPDRPSGRGQKLMPPPVKTRALEANLPVMQPERLRKEPDKIAWLQNLAPDFLVTAAFGQILSQEVLDIPKYGTVNVHASLLPKYRGPNPVQWAILNGDTHAGVTTMLTELGVDAGPMLLQREILLDPNENAVTLTEKLAQLGAAILPESLLKLADGTLPPKPQDESLVTHAPKLDKSVAEADWSQSALHIHHQIGGQQPWPGVQTTFGDIAVKLFDSMHPDRAEVPMGVKSASPGAIVATTDAGIWVQTGTVPLLIQTVQPAGKPKLPAKAWALGARLEMA